MRKQWCDRALDAGAKIEAWRRPLRKCVIGIAYQELVQVLIGADDRQRVHVLGQHDLVYISEKTSYRNRGTREIPQVWFHENV